MSLYARINAYRRPFDADALSRSRDASTFMLSETLKKRLFAPMRLLLPFSVLLSILLSAWPVTAAAAPAVKASLPPFPVQLNGVELDQAHSRYPFIFYKDITYLPLTWNNLEALGLTYSWSKEEGLVLIPAWNRTAEASTEPPEQDLAVNVNPSGGLSAFVAAGPVAIGPESIDNQAEPYPFLVYRDVTYMPLTWRFAHELLGIDIRWGEEAGLQVIGGQSIVRSLIGEDADGLYFYSSHSGGPEQGMLRMDKDSLQLEWRSSGERDQLRERLAAVSLPLGGEPAELVRKERDLYYGDLKLYTFTDSDLWESNEWGAPVHTYTEYKLGDNRAVITVSLRIPLPVAFYGTTTYNFLVRDGRVSQLENFRQRLSRVIPNPDGSAWIASAPLPARLSGYVPGSALLALLDADGTLHLVNEMLNELDVEALGLANPMLENPAAEDGSLYVILGGQRRDDYTFTPDTAGLYRLNTRLEPERLGDRNPAAQYFLDQDRNIYIQHRNNTVENWSSGELRTWYDYEIAGMGKQPQ
ncbi:MAG: hypothetical protein K0R57_1267 [Paenibacillaceae bacterium]|nr:hypothetical protein [Paenibacillaceae bacterium]